MPELVLLFLVVAFFWPIVQVVQALRRIADAMERSSTAMERSAAALEGVSLRSVPSSDPKQMPP